MKKSFKCLSGLLCALLLMSLGFNSCDKIPFLGEDETELPGAVTHTSCGVTLTLSLRYLTEFGVTFYGRAVLADSYSADAFGILYSTNEQITASSATNLPIMGTYGTYYSVSTSSLIPNTTYYYTSYIKQGSSYKYGEVKSFTTLKLNLSSAVDLSSSASANSYIVSKSGAYKFKTVKGNSSTSVGSVSTASVLWESFGTSTTPSVGDLVKFVSYQDGYIAILTGDTFKEGNAVIAAIDASGNILWSWHIWMTDEPQGQVYYNNAGTMMDRNLGATSATPGDVGALGLLYQWGRKDPFLGSSSISEAIEAKSTITWPSAVSSTSSTGTIAYATKNPTTFISYNSSNDDWYYTGLGSTDNTRWTTSDKTKSIYDPCPPGWRVPDGGSNGVWAKAVGSSSRFDYTYNNSNEGMNFSGKFGSVSTIWCPASGYRYNSGGSLRSVGSSGCYWSGSPTICCAYYLSFSNYGYVGPSSFDFRACGYSVRCIQE